MGSVGTELVMRIFAILEVYPQLRSRIKVVYRSVCYQLWRVITATSVKFIQLNDAFYPIQIHKGVTRSGEVVSIRSKVEAGAKQMQIKRINRIQRRAKRRLFALAIVASVFVGFSAISLFAADDRPNQVPLTKMSTAPGVKAVGIRLINPGRSTLLAPTSDIAQTAQTDSLPIPIAVPALSGSMPQLPLSQTNLSESLAQLPNLSEGLAQRPSLPSNPSQTGDIRASGHGQETAAFSNLPAPPRMSDVLAKNPNGRVVMKLGGSGKDKESLPIQVNQVAAPPQSNHSGKGSDSVEIRVIQPYSMGQPHSMGQPVKMPPFVFEKSARRIEPTPDPSASMQTQTAVRISIGDNVEVQGGSQANNRTPQLVKSKPTQLGHSVVLAQSTDLESQSSSNQPDEIVSTVEVETPLVPHSMSNGSIAPSLGSNPEPKKFVAHPSPTGSERRKFDTRLKSHSPIAIVELECLTATNMDLSGKLNAIAVQDENVCKVMQNERILSLVGNQVGTTLIQIWTADLGDKPQVVRVNVSQPGGKVHANKNEVNDIKQVIAQSFPRADVSIVSKEDGMIEVRGTTDSEESAKRILELVRKLYLVPVKDKLMVTK